MKLVKVKLYILVVNISKSLAIYVYDSMEKLYASPMAQYALNMVMVIHMFDHIKKLYISYYVS